MCSGSSTSATVASVNAPSNQLHHISYDNAAFGHLHRMPSSLPARRVYDFNPNIHGWKRPRGRPKTRWADSIKHDLNSAGLDTTNAAQMVFDRPQWPLLAPYARTRARLLTPYCEVPNSCAVRNNSVGWKIHPN